MARYLETHRNQYLMLPVHLEQLVDEDHLAKKIWKILNHIDLSRFDMDYQNDEHGAPAYKPINLLAVLIYAYASGLRSSRVIEQHCKDNFAYMYLSEMQKPDHSTLSRFRTLHREALEEVFVQTVFIGIELGLIDFKHIASDGTKIDGAGSQNKIIQGEKAEYRIEKYRGIVEELLCEAEQTDEQEKKTKVGKKIKKLDLNITRLEAVQKEYESCKTGVEKKDKKLRYHLTESEARLLKDKDGYHSGYNCQTSVDSKNQMILSHRVTQSENDSQEGLISREDLISRYDKDRLSGSVMSFDNGYHNQELLKMDGADGIELLVSQKQEGKQIGQDDIQGDDFRYLRERDVFICPAGKELTFRTEKAMSDGRILRDYRVNGCAACPQADHCFKPETKNKRQKCKALDKSKLDLREMFEAYQSKMKEPVVKKEYKKRMSTVEPVFGHMTFHRKASRFHVWGQFKAGMEFSLMCLTHNLVKLLVYGNIDDRLQVT
ncbi:MAG: IS5/IS1182 family transposase [bacterium]|nr:MAG: IS5/IS1182 family transposase [bacterium]